MVFEVVFFFVSLTALGAWLFVREGLDSWRLRRRSLRVDLLLAGLQGKSAVHAESLLGPPFEIVFGSQGRSLYIWKDPVTPAIPIAATLLIITLTVEADGCISHVAAEER
ncbi:MAG: hypothetical protein JNM66_09450 [Bryobacterales bacterium]|nr:hypothetical protein [Bryobacterales bacterium]